MRWRLRMKRERVGLVDLVFVESRFDMELVGGPDFDAKNQGFPDSRLRAMPQVNRAWFPFNEGADQGDRLGIRRPNAEPCAHLALILCDVASEVIVKANM